MEGADTTTSGLVAGLDSVNIIKTPTMETSHVPSPPWLAKIDEIRSQPETFGGFGVIPSPLMTSIGENLNGMEQYHR